MSQIGTAWTAVTDGDPTTGGVFGSIYDSVLTPVGHVITDVVAIPGSILDGIKKTADSVGLFAALLPWLIAIAIGFAIWFLFRNPSLLRIGG